LSHYKDFLINFDDEIIYPLGNLIGKYHSSFNVSDLHLKSFKNFPEQVEGSVFAYGNDFSSFEGITKIISDQLDISDCPHITSLSGIHKHLSQCSDIVVSGSMIKSNILGLLMIKKLKELSTYDDFTYFGRICEIVNKRLQSDRDVLECQEELITSGYNEYAKL